MEIWIGLGIIIVAISWLRSRRYTGVVQQPSTGHSSDSRGGRQTRSVPALTPIHEVVPIPPPVGWPPLPTAPDGLDGTPPPEEYIDVANRTYVRTTCPSCGVELQPLPKAKKRCRDCGKEIFVRSGPGGKRHLLAATELDGFEVVWADHHAARSIQAAAAQERAELEWRALLEAVGVQLGDYELDVVGESYRHAALAGIRAALIADPGDFEVRSIARLEREPDNPHDRHAIRVVIHDQMVGYLDRYSAEEYQPVLRRVRGPFYVQAVLMGGRATDDARVGPIGVRLQDVPEP